jgi:hypothetical protein
MELYPHRHFSSRLFFLIFLFRSFVKCLGLDQTIKQMAGDSVTEPEAHSGGNLAPVVSWGGGSAPSLPSVDNEGHLVFQHLCDLSTYFLYTDVVP